MQIVLQCIFKLAQVKTTSRGGGWNLHPHERLRETASSVPNADNLWVAGGKWRRAVRPAAPK